jgi:hypothetical protein
MWSSTENGVLAKGLKAASFPEPNATESRFRFRLIVLIACFVVLQRVLFYMFDVSGGFFTPARGSMAFIAHELTIVFAVAVFYLLVWSAVLRHLRCRELLNRLIPRTDPVNDQRVENIPQASLPPGRLNKLLNGLIPRRKSSLPMGALSKVEIRALLEYNQAVVRSILYPFAMLVVLLASRHPVFDAWNFPSSLLISSSVILGVLVFCAYLLNESANNLAEHQKKLFKPATDGTGSSEAIWESKELIGSFIPFWKQPVIQALTLAAAGLGLQWIQ